MDKINNGTRKLVFAALACFASMLYSTGAIAAGHWSPVVVERIGVDSSEIGFIRIDPVTSTAVSSPPTCATQGYWHAAFDAKSPAGQAILSMAMSAKLSKTPVRLIGANICSAYSTIEDVYVIDLLPVN